MRESGEIRLERAFDRALAAETRGREPASGQGWKTASAMVPARIPSIGTWSHLQSIGAIGESRCRTAKPVARIVRPTACWIGPIFRRMLWFLERADEAPPRTAHVLSTRRSMEADQARGP
jgi:hypothetical protein